MEHTHHQDHKDHQVHSHTDQHGHAIDESLGNHWGQRLGKFADTYWPFLVITIGAAFVFGIPFKHWVW